MSLVWTRSTSGTNFSYHRNAEYALNRMACNVWRISLAKEISDFRTLVLSGRQGG
jgi:hypothetical protein